MAGYPETIRVGIPPVQATYELQPYEFLVQFREDVDDERVDSILTEAKLPARRDDHARRVSKQLHGGHLRWTQFRPRTRSCGGRQTGALRGRRRRRVGRADLLHPGPRTRERGGTDPERPGRPVEGRRRPRGPATARAGGTRTKQGHVGPAPTVPLLHGQGRLRHQRPARAGRGDSRRGSRRVRLAQDRDLPARPKRHVLGNRWNQAQIGMVNAWDVQLGSAAVWIADIDSGFDLRPPPTSCSPRTPGRPSRISTPTRRSPETRRRTTAERRHIGAGHGWDRGRRGQQQRPVSQGSQVAVR